MTDNRYPTPEQAMRRLASAMTANRYLTPDQQAMRGLASVAFAALALQLGCPVDKLNEVYEALLPQQLPETPLEAVNSLTEAITNTIGVVIYLTGDN